MICFVVIFSVLVLQALGSGQELIRKNELVEVPKPKPEDEPRRVDIVSSIVPIGVRMPILTRANQSVPSNRSSTFFYTPLDRTASDLYVLTGNNGVRTRVLVDGVYTEGVVLMPGQTSSGVFNTQLGSQPAPTYTSSTPQFYTFHGRSLQPNTTVTDSSELTVSNPIPNIVYTSRGQPIPGAQLPGS